MQIKMTSTWKSQPFLFFFLFKRKLSRWLKNYDIKVLLWIDCLNITLTWNNRSFFNIKFSKNAVATCILMFKFHWNLQSCNTKFAISHSMWGVLIHELVIVKYTKSSETFPTPTEPTMLVEIYPKYSLSKTGINLKFRQGSVCQVVQLLTFGPFWYTCISANLL